MAVDFGDYVFEVDLSNPALEDIYQVTGWETGFKRMFITNHLTGQKVCTDPRCYKRWIRAELPKRRVEVEANLAILAEKRKIREERKSQKLQVS